MEQNNNTRRVISLLVDNSNGVLARISSLFCRRGFNIDSLTVSATNDPAVSRITVTLRGTEQALNQLILQTERLEVTRQIFELDPDKSLQRELLLLKVECDSQNRAELREISSIYKAKIIDLSPDSMIFELTGKPDKIDAFLTTTFWSSAAPASPRWSAAASTNTCRSSRRRSGRRSCPCRVRIAIELLVNFQCLQGRIPYPPAVGCTARAHIECAPTDFYFRFPFKI